jgi:hypothetical protein
MARSANVDNGVSAFRERLAMTIGRWARRSNKVSEHSVRNEVANNKKTEKYRAFHHTDPDAVPGVKLVEDPQTGSSHATTDLKHRLHADMAADGWRNGRVIFIFVPFRL